MDTIALFGGSFDPLHIGHKAIVKALQKLEDVDKIIIIPAFLNPFKSKSHAPSSLRYNWLEKVFNNFENVEIDDYELKQNKKINSVESVEYLLKKYSKIYLIIGADNLSTLHKWHDYDKLRTKVTFIIATRDNIEVPKSFLKLKIDTNISSTELRKNINISKLSKSCSNEIFEYYERIL